ncbi:MAG TPA: hypothetical protein VK709_15600 [Candidatus Saccharimonadales bacterium]|nr:hypothetical protein [Candidatus Saccharimonadales bacterium]
MNKLVFASALLFLAPHLCARQAETKTDSPQTDTQADPQPTPQNLNSQSNLPASLRPGHPLDPADVDILTGKRDREIQASQAAAGAYVTVGMSGDIGEYGRAFDVGLLPLTRISNPFFFSRFGARGFGRGSFGRGGFRGNR